MTRLLRHGLPFLVAAAGLAGSVVAARPPRPAAPVVASERSAVLAAVDAVYAVISGPAGQPRDFTRMRTLFTPEARLSAIGKGGQVRGGTVDDYIERSGKILVADGFTEKALVNRVEIYGDLAHVWSSYQGTFVADGRPGKVRGVNSFQLVRQPDGRWLVQSIFWQAETPAHPLPVDLAGAR